jgi:choline dehydrogenase
MASRQDLDNWVEVGNKGWGFSDLLPYYIKSETYHPTAGAFSDKVDDNYLDASLRGTSGPIHVSRYVQFSSCILTSLGLPTRR